MERIMIVMIALVAIVAVGGLLYIGVHQAPPQMPVFIEGPVMESGPAPGTVLGKATGQIKFKVVPPSDSATGQIKFEMT